MDIAAKLAFFLSRCETRGWHFEMSPHDNLNPGCGYWARVLNHHGREVHRSEALTPAGAFHLLLASID